MRYRCYLNSFLITSNFRKHAVAICTCGIMSVNCYKGSTDNLRTKGREDLSDSHTLLTRSSLAIKFHEQASLRKTQLVAVCDLPHSPVQGSVQRVWSPSGKPQGCCVPFQTLAVTTPTQHQGKLKAAFTAPQFILSAFQLLQLLHGSFSLWMSLSSWLSQKHHFRPSVGPGAFISPLGQEEWPVLALCVLCWSQQHQAQPTNPTHLPRSPEPSVCPHLLGHGLQRISFKAGLGK